MCPTSQPPSVCVTLDQAHTTLALAGELDLASRPLLEATCREAVLSARRQLLVDMEGVTFVDCGSLALLRTALGRASARLGTVPVVVGDRLVLRVMELTGFSRVHVVVSSVEEARRVLEDPPQAHAG